MQSPPCSLFTNPAETMADLRLLHRALRDGWDVPGEHRAALVEGVFAVIDQAPVTKRQTRAMLRAARVVMRMDGANLKDNLTSSASSRATRTLRMNSSRKSIARRHHM